MSKIVLPLSVEASGGGEASSGLTEHVCTWRPDRSSIIREESPPSKALLACYSYRKRRRNSFFESVSKNLTQSYANFPTILQMQKLARKSGWAAYPVTARITALTSVARLVGHHPAKQKVANLIPGQGTRLGSGLGPGSGHMQEACSHIDVSLLPFLPPFPSH